MFVNKKQVHPLGTRLQMNKTGWYIGMVGCVVWLQTACTGFANRQPQTPQPPTQTLTLWQIADTTCPAAYTVLTLEQWCGLPVTNADFETLNRFLYSLEQQITPRANGAYTRAQALQILQTIQQEVNGLRSQQVTYHSALYLCLRYRLFDCDINSLLFVTAAQHLNLPIQALLMPAHMSVVWNNGRQQIYWETTQNREVSLQYYRQKYQLPQAETDAQTPWLQPLNGQQITAIALFNIGQTYAEMGYTAQAMPYYRQAQQLFAQWFKPAAAAAHAYLKLHHPDSALLLARYALQQYAPQPDLPELMGNAYLLLGCNTEAAQALLQSAHLHTQTQYPDTETIARLQQQAGRVQQGAGVWQR